MDEDASLSHESEDENLRAMERDIDEFLSSIRENVSQNTYMQKEDTSSDDSNEFDRVSSDDCFEKEPLPSKSGDQGSHSSQASARKLYRQPFNNRNRMGRGNIVNHEKQKLRGSYPHEERRKSNRRNFQQSSWNDHHHQRSFSSRWKNENDPHKFPSPEGDMFHHEGCQSSSGDYGRGQSTHHQQRWYVPRGRHKARREWYPKEMDRSSQHSYAFNERNFYQKNAVPSKSGLSDDYESHRLHSRGSNSPIEWSESYDYDSDFEDEATNQPWEPEEDRMYMEEDNDGQDTVSILTTCLKKAIAYNPEIAAKVTKACVALLSKPEDGPPESDYDCDRDSWAAPEEYGKVSPQWWRGSKSPGYADSPDASSSRSGVSHHSDRFHGHSKRNVLEHSVSPDSRDTGWDKYNRPGRYKQARYSPNYKTHDDKRPSPASSQTERPRKRSFSEYSKNHHEEEFNLKGAVSWSIKKIRKKCEKESSSTVRRALLSLLEVHERECKMYLKKPEAHPDHRKEYRGFVEQKTKSIVDLGGDPNGYDFEQDWKKYWPLQMYKLFQESWNAKMQSCTALLQKRYGSDSKSSHSSSRKSSRKESHKKKQHTHEQRRKAEAAHVQESIKKRKPSTQKHPSTEDQQITETNSTILYKTKEMNSEILSILKLLSHIKYRFNDCEASFDNLYAKVINTKEDTIAINDILQADLPLLQKIDENLRQTLEDANLSLIQKVVIQETHERFKSFLKRNKIGNAHSRKGKEGKIIKKLIETMDVSMEDKNEEHQIPCHLTNSYPSMATSEGNNEVTVTLFPSCSCETNQQVGQPRRILTEISLVGSSSSKPKAPYTPVDASSTSFLPCSSDLNHCNTKLLSDITSIELHANRPKRTLTEIPRVKSSCSDSCVTDKTNVTLAGKDSGIMQPPPPGVTPSPPGMTLPHPGVTPSLSGVTTTSQIAALAPSDTTHSSLSGATQQPDVTPSCGAASPTNVKPLSSSITMLPCKVSAPPHRVTVTSSVPTVSHLVTSLSTVTPQSHSVAPKPSSSITNAQTSEVTPAVGVSQSSVVNSVHSSGSTSSRVSSIFANQATDNRACKTSQNVSSIPTFLEQNCEPSKNKVTELPLKRDSRPKPSKELLRSTIKDCFPLNKAKSIMSPEGLSTTDISAEGSSSASVITLPDDILKMFEVKPENNDKVNADDKSHAENDSKSRSMMKLTEKKPIKITIPMFSKQKSMPELSAMTDDQELL